MAAAAVLLVGGRSTRMGHSKAELTWHGQSFADRIARVLLRATGGPLVVVAAPGQPLPPLPPAAQVVTDEREGRGPLEGIAAGLRALPGDAVAYVSSTDVPLLHPALVRHVITAVEADVDIAVCETESRFHPLAGAYRATVLPAVESLLEDDRLRPRELFGRVQTRVLDAEVLLADPSVSRLDPSLSSLMNLNDPADYERAHSLELPELPVETFGTLRENGRGSTSVRAATLGALARTVGITLDEHVVAALNGDQITNDGAAPLVAGDEIAFFSADGGG